jgi:hypothetical protein
MSLETLTLKSIRARPVVLELKRPVVARIATLTNWPLILMDLYTEEGVIGPGYLEPYIRKSMRTSSLRSTISVRCLRAAGSLRSNFTKRPVNRFILSVMRACR